MSDDNVIMTGFETLIKNKYVKYPERWKPYSVSQFESSLSKGALKGMNKDLRKNMAYSLQYLEYLQMQIDELNLHSIIKTHILKSYIITSMSIVEGVFHHLLKSNNYYKKEDWVTYGETKKTNVYKEDNKECKLIITTLKKLDSPIQGEMDFETMINKVQDKKLLGLSARTYPFIKHLKRLRNAVHLQINRHNNDNDYFNINFHDFLLSRYILYKVLTDKSFDLASEKKYYDFIYPDNEQCNMIKEHFVERKRDRGNDDG